MNAQSHQLCGDTLSGDGVDAMVEGDPDALAWFERMVRSRQGEPMGSADDVPPQLDAVVRRPTERG